MKHCCILLLILFFSKAVKAQKGSPISLNIYGGYTFKDKVNFDGFYGYVNDAFQYGAGLEYLLTTTKSIEVKYLRMDTHLPLYAQGGTKLNEGIDKGSVNYILIGGNNYFDFGNPRSKTTPYGGFDIGFGVVAGEKSSTHFAWDAKLGIKLKTASAISLKLQAYIQNIVGAVGPDFYVYPGGAVIAVPDYAGIFQFGLGAVLNFSFNSR